MNFGVWLRAVRKYWWIVIVATLVSAGVGAFITAMSPAQYASTVTFFVRTPAEQLNGAFQGDAFAQKRVNSYVQLAESQRLADLVRTDTQLDLTAAQIGRTISARGDLNTVLLTITVTDSDPARSFDIAQSVSTQFVSLVSQLETAPGATTPSVSLEVTSAAALNPSPVAPRPFVNLGLAIAAGLLLGVVLALVREMLDKTIRSVETLRESSNTPVLAVIPFDTTAKNSPLIVHGRAGSVRAEALRQLRTNLQFVDVDNPVKTLVVTSSVPNEGKSSTAVNLAVAFAEAGRKVLLIEADLRRPRVADYLGLDGSIGLTNVLAGQVAVDEVLQPWGRGGLTILPSGSIPPNPSELLDSHNMQELLLALRGAFDIVIIDTPPLLPVTDGAIAAAHADGAILVVRHGKTTKSQLSGSLAALDVVDARLLGTVVNMAPLKGADSYGYGSYGYDYKSERPKMDESLASNSSLEVSPETTRGEDEAVAAGTKSP